MKSSNVDRTQIYLEIMQRLPMLHNGDIDAVRKALDAIQILKRSYHVEKELNILI